MLRQPGKSTEPGACDSFGDVQPEYSVIDPCHPFDTMKIELATLGGMSLPDHAELSNARPSDLLALYARILDVLRSTRVVRSTNNPAGDYGEYLTARAFGLSLVANSAAGYDAISAEGVRYQVKTRRLTAENGSRQLGFMRGFGQTEDPFDYLVGILFGPDFTVRRAALVPVAVVRANFARVDYVNGWRFILRDAIWSSSGVDDVTDQIRAAGGADAIPIPLVTTDPAIPSETSGRQVVARSTRPATSRRTVVGKADPDVVRAYFDATGLSRRELGSIIGTGVGVIATVQNPRGNRWSAERFERARAQIDAYLAARTSSNAGP